MQGLFWKYFFLACLKPYEPISGFPAKSRGKAFFTSTADSWRANSLFRAKWLEAWFDGMKDVWVHYIYKIFQHISYFSQLHLASGGKGQKWKPRVIQQSSGKFFYSRPFWTWKCIYKWLVPFPFSVVGGSWAKNCENVSMCLSPCDIFVVTLPKTNKHSTWKMLVFEQSSPFVLTSLFWWSILVSGFLLLYSDTP